VTAAPERGHAALRLLTRAAMVTGAATLALAVAACGSEQPSTPSAQAPASVATVPAAPLGTTVEVGGIVDVVTARIPAPPAGAATAEVEMTLADISAAASDTLRAASSPAARTVVFTSDGRVIPRIVIPVASGSSLTTGPPYPDRILLTGLRQRLRTGQTVTITLTFARAGQATLRVPVIPPVP
jgi:periplasmic copper chaperone A